MDRLADDYLGIHEAADALRNEYTGPRRPTYNMLYMRFRGGDLPAQRLGAMWIVRRADLAEIAASLGMSRKEAA